MAAHLPASASQSSGTASDEGILTNLSSLDSFATSTDLKPLTQSLLSTPSATEVIHVTPTSSTAAAVTSAAASVEAAQESETDSPLDNANFLSFEEWRRQNLAKVGQSAENLGARANEGSEQRRRPGNINHALDSLGEDGEIDIDFGGFVDPGPLGGPPPVRGEQSQETFKTTQEAEKVDQAATDSAATRRRSKDAGKTCKERTNYASYDCAATTLKTNPECKSSSAVLVENKDSYMLNICSAKNKFFIVELCDDILIDTVVLANFEFFSSMFRTFRVSVSDRYPAKPDKWRELGSYEARNSREVQAFLVRNPLIWARYLRIEFLTHYGNEYYCPVSLLRVHGTTMMEEFNTEVKNAGGGEDIEVDEVESEGEEDATHVVGTADAFATASQAGAEHLVEKPVPTNASPASTTPDTNLSSPVPTSRPNFSISSPSSLSEFSSHLDSSVRNRGLLLRANQEGEAVCLPKDSPRAASLTPSNFTNSMRETITSAPRLTEVSSSMTTFGVDEVLNQSLLSNTLSIGKDATSSTSKPTAVSQSSGQEDITNFLSSSADSASLSTARVQSSSTQPPASNPTTQESFFKSVHKRLQLLEANSTLSLQYIEEQSRILRDAFSKVEKRQLGKTSTFLETLNTTVLTELREFRMQYDQIWQSTVLELSSQREQSQHEVFALSARLGLLADEIVFQKRMAILQFLLILLCLGLVIFSKHGSSTATYLELPPLVQNAINKSSANLSRYAPHFETPPTSPCASRPSSRYGIFSQFTHRRSPSEESYNAPRDYKGPSIEYSPPTPESQRSVAGDADSSPGPSQKEGYVSDDPPEAQEDARPSSAPGIRNAKSLEELPANSSVVDCKLDGEDDGLGH